MYLQRRWVAIWSAVSLCVLLQGCATPQLTSTSTQAEWQGRLSVTVQSDPPSASSASFSSPLKFSYTFPQRIALMCTKTGLTTFKIYTGTNYKTHTMSCSNRTSDARNIVANPVVPADPPVPGTPVNATFTVQDRWGSPVRGVTVRFSTSGAGQVDTAGDQVTDANGVVTAAVSSQAAGDQVVTAIKPTDAGFVASIDWQGATAQDKPILTDSGGFQVMSLSPELFFALNGDRITVKPMKGTAPRAQDIIVDQQQAWWRFRVPTRYNPAPYKNI